MLAVEEISEIASRLEDSPPQEIVSWAVNTFNKGIAFACSFGMEDVCIVDMIAKTGAEANIFYLDTSLLFKETHELIQKLGDRYGIKFESVRTECTLEQQAEQHGDDLWTVSPDLCCNIRKVAPLKKKLSTLEAWMTGIRRDQTKERAHAKTVEWDKKFGLVKVNPLVRWTSSDTRDYITKHGVPYNPLHDKGYPSIGCEPCTFPVKPGEDPRAGRWKGFAKKECGLHK
ncbi:MAG: phosphoadenylyl-sulfate reductase [Deltaproteobacteria bacterium]|nr:phosphoadenylyl-sulfate reductase [Deltaproteobacteria bacterium]MCL5277579.1 phosphoadenylyl-sulfate reductase [Deltaproteobacteria bacterium]